MNLRIIYPTDDGGVAIVIPAPEARQQVKVSEAVTEVVTHAAVLNDDGIETSAAYEETVTVTPAVYRDQTDDEFAQWIAAKDIPLLVRYESTGVFEKDEDTGEMYETQREIKEPRPYKIIDTADVPSDRTFRSAWEYTE